MAKKNTNPVKGMRDLLPTDTLIRDYVMSIIQNTYKKYGFTRIETPVVENIEFLTNKQGGENESLIFKILKRGEKLKLDKENLEENDIVEYGLRYDLTVPLSRFFANNKENLPRPFKAIQYGPVFRAEKAQKGRYRQFIQCDIDILGDESSNVEIELITVTSEALSKLGFNELLIKINDRRILKSIAKMSGFAEEKYGELFIILDKFDKIGLEGIKNELIQNNFDKFKVDELICILNKLNDKDALNVLEDILNELDVNVAEQLRNIISTVDRNIESNIKLQFDPYLVRGMGYYTGPIFEITSKEFNSSLGGGGRYDKMIGNMIGQDVPACGFSIGFERITDLLNDKGFKVPNFEDKILIIYDKKEEGMFDNAFDLATRFRKENKVVSLVAKRKNVNKQIDEYKNLYYNKFAIIDNRNDFTLKDID